MRSVIRTVGRSLINLSLLEKKNTKTNPEIGNGVPLPAEFLVGRRDTRTIRPKSEHIFEIRTNFKVIDVYGAEREIDSERFAGIATHTDRESEHVYYAIGGRLKCYFMTDEEANQLIGDAINFLKETVARGRRGKIPVVVDLDVCTVQQEGESIDATVDRALRPEYFAPLHIYPVDWFINPGEKPRLGNCNPMLEYFLRNGLGEAAIRVEDVEKGLGIMEECGVCGRKPMLGTKISTIRCGHAFHYHCIVRYLVNDISCPTCGHPAHDEIVLGRRNIEFDALDCPEYVSPDELSE